VGWFLVLWVLICSVWLIVRFDGKNWTIGLVGFIWLVFIPFNGYLMGMLSAYCWRNQTWIERRHEEEGYFVLMWFWLVGFVPVLALAFTIIGILVPFIHGAYFNKGRKRGELFVKTNELGQMMGWNNQWERSEGNRDGIREE